MHFIFILTPNSLSAFISIIYYAPSYSQRHNLSTCPMRTDQQLQCIVGYDYYRRLIGNPMLEVELFGQHGHVVTESG